MKTEEAALTEFMRTVDCDEAIPYSECIKLWRSENEGKSKKTH